MRNKNFNEEERRETCTSVFRDYYNRLNKLERLFLIVYIIATAIYSILFVTFLILTGNFEKNYAYSLLLIFPIASGITTVSN